MSTEDPGHVAHRVAGDPVVETLTRLLERIDDSLDRDDARTPTEGETDR